MESKMFLTTEACSIPHPANRTSAQFFLKDFVDIAGTFEKHKLIKHYKSSYSIKQYCSDLIS